MKCHIGVVGAGLSGAVIARELANTGRFKVTIFDERNHVAGNCHTSRDDETGIMVHQYGTHIFHTDREDIWDYMNGWGRFEPYVKRVKAHTNKGVFSFPINLLTINQFFNRKFGPDEAKDFISSIGTVAQDSDNFEEYGRKYFGKELYENFFHGYTKKRWGVDPEKLSASLIERLPIRFSYDDNYYNQRFQGIPVSGYTEIIKRILDHQDIEIRLGQRMEPNRKRDFDHLFWSGPLDGYFDFQLGRLNYRTLTFEKLIGHGDYQGNAIINYCHEDVPFNRISEHKHLTPWEHHEKTICFKEFSGPCGNKDIPYYPIRTYEDVELLKKYVELARSESHITFVGRLGTYRYLEMQKVIAESLDLAKNCLSNKITDWPKFSVNPLTA